LVPGVTFEVIQLTPEVAKELLDRLPERQRAQSQRSIDRYASDLLEGEFPFTGDPIRVDVNGELIDGQHRCVAVMETGITVPALVIRGLPTERIRYFDGGRPRRFQDDLRIAGYANHANLATLTTRVWHWQHGNYGYMGIPYVRNAIYSNTQPTRAQLWATLHNTDNLPSAVTNGNRIGARMPNAPVSVISFVWWLLGTNNLDAREKFFHELVDGSVDNGAAYPINVLRRQLTRRMGPTEAREGYVWIVYFIKAYNAWVEGRSISYLRMPVPVRWNSLPMPHGMERPGLDTEIGQELDGARDAEEAYGDDEEAYLEDEE
jgi:hypothetical protein